MDLVTSLSHGGGPKLMNIEILLERLKNIFLTGALWVFFCVVEWDRGENGEEEGGESVSYWAKGILFSEINQ